MPKYANIGGNYYTVGGNNQLRKISESDVLNLSGSTYTSLGTQGGLAKLRQEGEIMDVDPSQLTLEKEIQQGTDTGMYKIPQLNLGGSLPFIRNQAELEALGLGGKVALPTGTVATSTEYQDYLKTPTTDTLTGKTIPAPGGQNQQPYNPAQPLNAQGQPQKSKYEAGFEKANAELQQSQPVSIRRDSANNLYGIFADGTERKLTEQEAFASGLGINEKFVPAGQTVSLQQARTGQNTGSSAMDVSESKGTSLVNTYAPPKRNDLSTTYVQTDPYIGNLVNAWQEYINPENQRASLTETYNQMLKDSGIQALDTELLDMKNVIEGSEDDLRTEITKAGGFATESQIQALTNARNKQLIKNYNTLLETRDAKEKYLQTSLQLEQADRESADQRFESMFNMGLQIANYQQQMQQNARSQMQWLSQSIGLDGLYNSTGGDPYYVDLVEQTLGLPSGGLLSAAQQVEQERMRAQQEEQLKTQLTQEQIKTEQAQRAKIYSEVSKAGTADEKQKLRSKNSINQADLVTSKVDEALKSISGYNTGLIGKATKNIAGTSAYNLNQTINTIKSNVAFQALQAMREASPTGGALGQVAVQELEMLQNTIASLDIGQDKDQLTKNLSEVKQRFENVKATIIANDEGKDIAYDDKGNVIIIEN